MSSRSELKTTGSKCSFTVGHNGVSRVRLQLSVNMCVFLITVVEPKDIFNSSSLTLLNEFRVFFMFVFYALDSGRCGVKD